MIAVIADQLGKHADDQVHQVPNLCTADSTIRALSDGSWANEAKKAGCEYIGGVFAEGLAIAAAGASGPGAIAVGPVAYQALAAGVSLACDGDLRNALQSFGYYVEAHFEAKVAKAVSSDADLCMRDDATATIEQWSAVPCA